MRFRTLDGMRGVAALTVVLLHAQSLYGPACTSAGTCNVRFGHLAVDMFFALSGFVLSHRYDAPMAAGMRAASFMRLRLVRLGPIYWLGAAIGAGLLVQDLMFHGASLAYVLRVTAFNVALLPAPTFHPDVTTFVLVPPAWSLFLEFWVANLAFGLIGGRLRGPLLVGLIIAGGLGLVAAELWYGHLDLGWYWGGMPGALARVTYSFFAGVAVRRIHARHVAPRLPALVVVAVMVASFGIRVPAGLGPAYELACVIVLYPALIYVGASATERRPLLGAMLGDISYALYVIHVPMMRIALQLADGLGDRRSFSLAAVTVIAIVAAAVAVDALYDRRVRRVLGTLIARRTPGAVPRDSPPTAFG
ncbi:MAG: acyltransferase family protein [Janthinobacterium lividum]